MIGIVSIARNVSDFLNMAVESCVAQQEVNWKLYIAYEPNSSTDDTEEKLQSWSEKDKRIVLVPGQREEPVIPRAVNDAANVAIKDGVRYITRLDMDNYWCSPLSLKMLRDGIERNGADLAWGDHIKMERSESGEWYVSGYSSSVSTVDIGELVRGPNLIPGNGIIMKSEVWQVCPWREDFVGGWDVQEYLCALSKGFKLRKIADHTIPVVVNRIREEGAFHQSLKKTQNEKSRWEKWRKQLLDELPKIREEVIKNYFGEV